jgi:RNA polymerase sigma factor (sigma-70 family)
LTTQAVHSEEELVLSLKKKEEEAFRYLYLHYRGSLFSVINQIIPDKETAGDVLQEVFIAVWKNAEKYDPEKGRLFTWLLNIARNTAINKTRSKNYKNALKNEELNNTVYSSEKTNDNQVPVNTIGLRKEVRRLKEDLKQVLELSYFHGCTQDEISKALNIPLGTVKTRLRSAIIELRKKFR